MSEQNLNTVQAESKAMGRLRERLEAKSECAEGLLVALDVYKELEDIEKGAGLALLKALRDDARARQAARGQEV